MIYTIVLFDKQNQATDIVTIDSITEFSESYSATATSHPVETGTPLTDNLIQNNDKFTVSGVVSDFSMKGFGKKLIIESTGNIVVDQNSIANTQTDRAYSVKRQLIDLIKVGSIVGIVVSKKPITASESFVVTNQGVVSENSIEIKYPCVCTGADFSETGGEYGVIKPKLQFEKIRLATSRTEKVDKIPAVLTRVTPSGTAATGDATGEVGELPAGVDVINDTKKYVPPDNITKSDVKVLANQMATDDAIQQAQRLENITKTQQKLIDEIKAGDPKQVQTQEILKSQQNGYVYK